MSTPSLILRVAVPVPLHRCFDYLPPPGVIAEQLKKGIRVRVPFGNRKIVGVVVGLEQTSTLPLTQLKSALEIIDEHPLFSAHDLRVIHWASEYYHHPLGEVYACALPRLLRLGKNTESKRKKKIVSAPLPILSEQQNVQLNAYQQQACTTVIHALDKFQTFLLNGITGSGKTEVYLQIVSEVLRLEKQALILVPEIGLTPQITERFQQRFNEPLAVFHSGLNDSERLRAWNMARNGQARIIIGTRSAIFTPLPKPGVIIIDEEHDASFKQQEGFRYSARDVAVVRGRLENIPVVLGSATPSLESLYNVVQKRYQHLLLPERVGQAIQPPFRLLDLRHQQLDNGLSMQLIAHMQQHLAQGNQVLLFLNRRGFAPVLICNGCGWVAACKRCDAKMTLHQYPPLLQCHHCSAQRAIDKLCPNCQNPQLLPLGLGTQRLELTLNKYFPDKKVVRIDRDSTRRKGALNTILQGIHQGENQILIGTQMLAKGHHFPEVTLVAILNADNGLFSADFRAVERMGQLLVQVSGRAGRAERPGEVVIQTHHPEHPFFQFLQQQDYLNFSQALLTERRAAGLPPFGYCALLRAEATNKSFPLKFLEQVRDCIKSFKLQKIEVLGPIASLMERKQGQFRAQLLVQAEQRQVLHQVLKLLFARVGMLSLTRRVRWSLDVDPLEVI